MSPTRASVANRTKARGRAAAEISRVIGSFVLSDAVWNVDGRFSVSTPAMIPACNTSTNAPRLADPANVLGERLENRLENLAAMFNEADGFRAGSASIAANSFCMARAEGAPRLSFRLMVSAYSFRMTPYCLGGFGW